MATDHVAIRKQIQDDNEFTVGALLTLYDQQTRTEKNAYTTLNNNLAGFNAVDAKILTDIANFYLTRGFLSPKQIKLVRTKLMKYSQQLVHYNIKKMPLKAPAEAKKPKKKGQQAKYYTENKLILEFDYDIDLIVQIKKISGKMYHKQEKVWSVPLTLINIEKARTMGFTIDSKLKAWENSINEGVTEDFVVDGLDEILKNYQKFAVSYTESRQGRVLIADEQGLGKTLESIAWIQHKKEEVLPCIIVCPASLKLNWRNEINKFTDLGRSVEILYGKTPYNISKNIIIINYDILYFWKSHIMKTIKPKLIVADEIHLAKNVGTKKKPVKRTVALKTLSKNTKHFIGLSGTPIENRPKEIFEPLKMINPKIFPNFRAFANRYCAPKYNGFGWDFNGASNTVELNKLLCKEVMLRRKKEDVLKELPDKQVSLIPVTIDNVDEYAEAERDVIRYLKEKVDNKKAEKAKKAEMLAKINILKQLASKGKKKQILDWGGNFIEKEKLVLFCDYRETAKELYEKFKDKAVMLIGGMSAKQKEEAQNRFWNDNSVKLFIGNIKAAGVGINLQCASHVGFVEYPWTPGAYSQCTDRCHRMGQKNAVNVWNIAAQNTIETDLVMKLEEKSKITAAVLDGNEAEDSGLFNEIINNLLNKE